MSDPEIREEIVLKDNKKKKYIIELLDAIFQSALFMDRSSNQIKRDGGHISKRTGVWQVLKGLNNDFI
jgi:hypothetical protein